MSLKKAQMKTETSDMTSEISVAAIGEGMRAEMAVRKVVCTPWSANGVRGEVNCLHDSCTISMQRSRRKLRRCELRLR